MQLNEQEAYLRNLIALAKADDVVLLEENDFLIRTSRAIGATPGLLPHLLGESKPDVIDLTPLTRYSTRVRCLEDMIELAMVDGNVDLDEKRVLYVAAHNVGIEQDTVSILVNEARARQAASGRATAGHE